MSEVKTHVTVSHDQAARLIAFTPDVRFFLVGEPGIGKSSILSKVIQLLDNPDKPTVGAYIDCSTLDLGDTAMPVINRDLRVTEYYPNARFKLHEKGVRRAIMLDELTKAMGPVHNMLIPTLESSNPRLGDLFLNTGEDGDIVFATGNLGSDGVGDNMKSHVKNRLVRLHVRKPTQEEWLYWAVDNDIDPIMLAFVNSRADLFDSYTDYSNPEDIKNHHIFNPYVQQDAFFTPRSAETASRILQRRDVYPDRQSLEAALQGAIGKPTATDLMAFVQYQDELPAWDSIISNPTTADVPEKSGAQSVVIYNAISKVTDETASALMLYLRRFAPEWQCVFAVTIAKTPKKSYIAFQNEEFGKWLADNQDLL